MSLEVLLIKYVIGAYEGLEVTTFNVTGYLLMADQDEVINITLRGKISKRMVKNCPISVPKIRCDREGENGAIRAVTKGAIRLPTQCTTVGQEVTIRPRIKRVRTQPLLPLSCKQDNKREVIYYYLAR